MVCVVRDSAAPPSRGRRERTATPPPVFGLGPTPGGDVRRTPEDVLLPGSRSVLHRVFAAASCLFCALNFYCRYVSRFIAARCVPRRGGRTGVGVPRVDGLRVADAARPVHRIFTFGSVLPILSVKFAQNCQVNVKQQR